MKTIFKYEVPIDDQIHTIPLPSYAKVLHVGMQQEGHVTFWAFILTDRPTIDRYYTVVGTGQAIEHGVLQFVGSVFDGPFVWHLLEITDPG